MGRSLLTGALLVAGCGRIDFDLQPPAAPPPVLACGAPARFAIGAGLPTLGAVATPAGFAILGVDGARALRGWTFDWTEAEAPAEAALAAGAHDVALASDATPTAGVAALGAEVVVASIYGGATPLGSRLHALDAELTALAPASARAGLMVGEAPIARGGGAAAEDLALISVDATGRVDARRIDTAGAELSPVQIAVDPAEVASSVRIAAGRDGYVLSWTSAAAPPNKKRVARLDRDLARVAGPVTVASGTAQGAIRGSLAWLAGADRYLIAWFEKSAATGDDVCFQILDGELAPATAPVRLAQGGVTPQIGTDGAHFFVAWKDTAATPDALAVAVITSDGSVTRRAMPSSGGSPLGYAFVERDGQAVLAWSETGGTGPDLWLDPMCPGEDAEP